ncbi:hypothetical protein [Aquabacterium sp.]|uniref:hypothetical protein n=1 Tax=Aquabacterium sp. TaxID=1872578 RepID=UPI003D6D9B67
MSELNGPARPRARRPRGSAKGAATPPPALPTRLETLRDALVHCVDLLKQRRADLIPPSDIDEFIDLDWMVWDGGNLTLTLTGSNICRQARSRAGSADG